MALSTFTHTYFVWPSPPALDETLWPLKNKSQFSPPPSPSLWIWLLQVPHVSGITQYLSFYGWSYCPQHNVFKVHPCGSMYQNPLLRLNNILLHRHTTCCLRSHLMMDIWAASTPWLLCIMLLSTLLYKYLFESLFSIPLRKYPEIKLLDYMVILSLIYLRNYHTVFQNDIFLVLRRLNLFRIPWQTYAMGEELD